MLRMRSRKAHLASIALALLCGALLRWSFIHRYALVAGDSLVYGGIARNWLLHGVYAFSDSLQPTLIRLPGYPLFLACVFKLFGIGNYRAVMLIQAMADLLTCWLIALFVRDFRGKRGQQIALWTAALCPFTAMYVAAPLTETLSIFCVALAMLAASRCLRGNYANWRWPGALAFALAYAILLRPDGGLLAAVVLGCLLFRARLSRTALAKLAAVSVLTLLPLVPWTIRNWRTFHVFQPLAPRYANDPGEPSEAGYKAWVKTWFVDAASNEEFYWCANSCPLDIRLLPDRAFDSPRQRQQTEQLLLAVNQATIENDTQDPRDPVGTYDSAFAALAGERNAAHPFRSHIELPLLRLADMLLRPRTELLPLPLRWWEWRKHPAASIVAFALALLNAAYLFIALIAFARRRVPLAGMLLAYVALRCALLLTLENSEPRYTLEFFPIILAAAVCNFVTCERWSSSSSSSR